MYYLNGNNHFIYKIKNVNKTFYGKYISDYMSDDH